MGIIARRRKRFQQLFNQLETLLASNGVTPCHFFKDTNLLNYLACVPFNNLLYSLNITRVNIHLTVEEKLFVGFILKYRQTMKKKVNLLLDTPPEPQYFDSPPIGWRENLRYEEEMSQYRKKLEEYQHQKEILEKRRKELWRSSESEIFRYVEKEDRAAVCPDCMGSGRMPSSEASPEPTDCPRCYGKGTSGYIPKVTLQQRQVAETFRAKLDNLNDPVFSNFPCKKKSVFIRVNYDGQIFIK